MAIPALEVESCDYLSGGLSGRIMSIPASTLVVDFPATLILIVSGAVPEPK
jgi:hypothetical protein